MNEMIKRVARAITAKFAQAMLFQPNTGGEWIEKNWRLNIPLAEAAIAAMREPIDAATLAGAKAFADQIYGKADVWNRGYIQPEFQNDWLNGMHWGWTAMIDAALAED